MNKYSTNYYKIRTYFLNNFIKVENGEMSISEINRASKALLFVWLFGLISSDEYLDLVLFVDNKIGEFI